MPADAKLMEKLVALCKRRGFIFQSSEIYGGIGGFWDYGPLGVELKRNIKETWWRDMVINPPDGPDGKEIEMVGVDCSLIMNPKVWEASGHVGGFSDPMVDCKECKARFRADQGFTSGCDARAGARSSPPAASKRTVPTKRSRLPKRQAKKLSKKHGGGEYVAAAVDFDRVEQIRKWPSSSARASDREVRSPSRASST
jgi:glycyl-tRNA synthetase